MGWRYGILYKTWPDKVPGKEYKRTIRAICVGYDECAGILRNCL